MVRRAGLLGSAAWFLLHSRGSRSLATVSPPSVPAVGFPATEMRVICPACTTHLVVPLARANESGPCPKCGAWIDAAAVHSQQRPVSAARDTLAPRRRGSAHIKSGRGRVSPDGYIDHGHAEQQEIYGTLKVLAVFMAVLALILFVIIYGRPLMAE